MHELSIAMSIVEMAQEEAQLRGNAKIKAVHMRLGLLSGVVKESLHTRWLAKPLCSRARVW
jgi:hydrogenase nickel incorporation protein HypA/HybF